MADSCETETEEEHPKKLTKMPKECHQNTAKDLQIIFKKLRVDSQPKRLMSKNNATPFKRKESYINRRKGITSKRKILRDATFVYKSTNSNTDNAHAVRSITTQQHVDLSIHQDKSKPETIDVKTRQITGNINTKIATSDKKTGTDIREFSESCSGQFRRAQCSRVPHGSVNFDDTTPEELAAYFDQMLHIPKAMSAMAEMMYT